MRIQNSEFRIRIARALITVAVLTACARAVRAEVIDRVLAVVAGQPITLSDVIGARDLGFESAEGASDPLRAVLSRLIDRELMSAEAERYGPPEPTAEAVDRDVARVRARFATPADFAGAAARSGIDDKHLRETVRQNLRIAAYLDQRFTAAGERRQVMIDEWVAGLRRRGNVLDLYLPGR